MPAVLRLNDLNGLASQCHVYKHLNKFYVAFGYLRTLIRLGLTCSINLGKTEVNCSMTCLNCNAYQYPIKVTCLFIECSSWLCSNENGKRSSYSDNESHNTHYEDV